MKNLIVLALNKNNQLSTNLDIAIINLTKIKWLVKIYDECKSISTIIDVLPKKRFFDHCSFLYGKPYPEIQFYSVVKYSKMWLSLYDNKIQVTNFTIPKKDLYNIPINSLHCNVWFDKSMSFTIESTEFKTVKIPFNLVIDDKNT